MAFVEVALGKKLTGGLKLRFCPRVVLPERANSPINRRKRYRIIFL